MHRIRRAIGGTVVVATLALLPGAGDAAPATTSGQVASDSGGDRSASAPVSKPANRRSERAAPGADAVGKRLHQSAKAFGDALLDGAKFVGRTIANAFQ
jgi:hypothetical protein